MLVRNFRGCQPKVDNDAADDCRVYVATMKAMNFKNDFASIPIEAYKDQYLLELGLN